ncbi:MAG: nitrite reductase small subunit NirD [Ignavibacteriaceae bacterium]
MKSSNHFKKIPEGFRLLCRYSELKEKSGKRMMIDDIDMAVFKVNGNVFVMSNICPHQHSALIYDGQVEDGYVFCPVHGWKFELGTGKTPSGNCILTQYETIVSEDSVYARIPEKKYSW